jgi:hypothetical protein
MSRNGAESGGLPPMRAASKPMKYVSVVSMRCPNTSRTCQSPAPVGAIQTSGSDASANMPAASRRTASSRLSLLS